MAWLACGDVGPLAQGATIVGPDALLRQLAGAAAVALAWETLDEQQRAELLALADKHDIPLAIVFETITESLLADTIFEHRSILLPLDRNALRSLTSDQFSNLSSAMHRWHPWDGAEGDAVEIGTLFPLQGRDDPDGFPTSYEEQRSLSLVSATVVHFIRNLRSAALQMRRPPVEPRFDPFDQNPLAKPVGGNWQLNVPQGQKPTLSDVFRVPDQASKWLPTEPADPSWATKPPRLLLLGESGTGKTLVSRLVHRFLWGDRADRAPFVPVNLGGRNLEQIDYELHGAATGYYTEAAGAGALARGAFGTVFFDEIGDLPHATQPRLFGYLDDGIVRPFGLPAFPSHSQVIAATNRPIDTMVSRDQFRHDLRARFALVVRLPPLRERGPDEIERLVDFVAQNPAVNPLRDDGQFAVTHITRGAIDRLRWHTYPNGNFRELEETVNGAVAAALGARRRFIDVADVSLRPTLFRPEDEKFVVRVTALPEPGSADRVVAIEDRSDLFRMADARGLHVLLDHDGNAALLDAGTLFTTKPSESND